MKKPFLVVIDDEEDILENYRGLLVDDFTVQPFQDPELFLKSLEDPQVPSPDLVITDLKMPSMDGLEMIRRAQKLGHYFPFILLSGFLSKNSAIEAVETGVYRILEKPTEFGVLSATIDQLLIEHDVKQVRDQIRKLTSQLRELYTSVRLAVTQYIPPDIAERMVVDAPNGSVKKKMGFDDLMSQLEAKLDTLLASEKTLNEMRVNKMRP